MLCVTRYADMGILCTILAVFLPFWNYVEVKILNVFLFKEITKLPRNSHTLPLPPPPPSAHAYMCNQSDFLVFFILEKTCGSSLLPWPLSYTILARYFNILWIISCVFIAKAFSAYLISYSSQSGSV